MRTMQRSLRTLARSGVRSSMLLAVLAVSIGLTLTMITVDGAFARRLDVIRSEVGTDLTVRPAGTFGGGFGAGALFGSGGGRQGGGAQGAGAQERPTLSDEHAETIAKVEHVAGMTRIVTAQYQGADLRPGIALPQNLPQGFALPVLVTGTDDPYRLSTLGIEEPEFTEGRAFTEDELGENVVVVGLGIAKENGLGAGTTLRLNGESFSVLGVYSSGTRFGDNSIFMPLSVAQRMFDRVGAIDEIRVRADSAENTQALADRIREVLGADVVDVSSAAAQYAAIAAPVADAKKSSEVGLLASLGASGAIILFAVGLVARQRVKEIGILKAIGASNWNITSQLGIEAGVVACGAALIGALGTFPLAQAVADGLVPGSADGTAGSFQGGGFQGGGGPAGAFRGGFGGVPPVGGARRPLGAGDAQNALFGGIDVAVSPEIFLYAIAIAVGLAVVASIVPAWYVAHVRPAEVLRNE